MLHVHFSNRYEILSDLLLSQLAGAREDVFARYQVIVPSSAVARALNLQLADREGVCANVEFAYLAHWLWEQVARVVTGVADESPFDSAALAWRVHAAFGEREFVAPHPRLAAYLHSAGADEVMRYELAVRVAALLEQYVTYRTDWLAQWQGAFTPDAPIPDAPTPTLPQRGRGNLSLLPPPLGEGGGGGKLSGTEGTAREDETWQAALWRRIAGELDLAAEHPVALLVRALERGGLDLARSAGLPSSLQVFALVGMPPLHMQALQALGRWIDVHVYALNPCREYWFDLVDPKRLSQLEAAGQEQGFEVGHPLLASWGKQTQSSLALLTGLCDGCGAETTDAYAAADSPTLLARVQNSILDLQELEPASIQLASADRSIEVHVCHSLTRELEVLHDHLLGLFVADATLQPCDILVVTPDLAAAAPLIEAVFGTVPAQRRIAFAITGLPGSSANAPAKALLELLALAASRCAASDVYGLLQQPVVARRFHLDESDLERVHDWVLASGIHWGADAEHVTVLDLPQARSHTLAGGLERLYLGYALPDEVQEPFDSMLPCGKPEGTAALALGAFASFVESLQRVRREIAQPMPASEWIAWLHVVADEFLSPGAGELEDHLEMHATIDELGDTIARGGIEKPLGGAVIRAALQSAFEDSARGGVPTGRVTFAGMSSLRNLPFKVVCAIGLNDTAFPAPDRPPEFDLMAQAPRLGDRQRRTDQRTLFLDLLLAARSSLYLSYVGRSIYDNATLPPSVLVSELLDLVVPAVAAAGDSEEALQAARRRLVVSHPLQPFSPEAFTSADERVRSFDAELAQALRESMRAGREECHAGLDPASRRWHDGKQVEGETWIPGQARDDNIGDSDISEGTSARDPVRPFFTAPLPPAGPEWRAVTLPRLLEFFNSPSRFLLRRRLRIDLPWDEAPLADDEPFLPELPARSRLARRLLPALLAGADRESIRRLAEAGTELPAGALGEAEMQRELASLHRFAEAVRQASAGEPRPPHQASATIDIGGEPWTVDAGFADLRSTGHARWRYDDERGRDVLEAWISHLVLCSAPPADLQPVTRSIARDGVRTFATIAPQDAKARLAELVHLYRDGLCEPLHFFAKTSWTFVQDGASKALQSWRGTLDFGGDADKPGHRLAFRGQDEPLDDEFQRLARSILADMPSAWSPHAAAEDPP